MVQNYYTQKPLLFFRRATHHTALLFIKELFSSPLPAAKMTQHRTIKRGEHFSNLRFLRDIKFQNNLRLAICGVSGGT
jgi:hypothetical protein